MSDSIIQINNMNKWFGDFQVLKGINLEVKPKEKIVVCGPSGSGKSTLIRCINRLEEHQEGNIVVDGTELTEDTKNIEQIRAEVGMLNLAKTNPKWLGFAMEGYVFAAIIFWIICYAMSKYSYNLEQKYKTDR